MKHRIPAIAIQMLPLIHAIKKATCLRTMMAFISFLFDPGGLREAEVNGGECC